MSLKKYHIIKLLLLSLATVSVFACSSDDNDAKDADGGVCPYITLSLSAASATRSNPNGGEVGDGTEGGINNENKVHFMVLFFFRDADAASVESDKASASLVVVNVDSTLVKQPSGGTSWTTDPIAVKNLVPDTKYHLIAVANGVFTELMSIRTLGELQKYIQTTAWKSAAKIADYDNFVMSSSFNDATFDAPFKVTSLNVKDNPANVNISLRRLAARVDILPYTSTNSASAYHAATATTDAYYEYPVKGTNNKVRVSDIKLVNQMTAGTYLLKHFANPTGTGIASTDYFIGKENPESGNQTNYVVDPWTRSKTISATSMNDQTGNSRMLSYFYKNYFTSPWSGDAVQSCDKDKYYTLGYTMENTMAQECQLTKYTTGLLLKATFVPNDWYELVGGVLTVTHDAMPGDTFYRYGGNFYATPEALAAAVNAAEGTSYTAATVLGFTGKDTYEKGVCYYNYWIRHSNNNSIASSLMEFAIVRDNIYRLTINSFSGIGTPAPDIENHPDEGNVDMTVRVLQWSIFTHSTIYL